MSDIEKKQKQFYNRAQHQLREIEFSCRQVVGLAQNIKLVGGELDDLDINCKKIEFIKGQIKEKLREVASNIDEVYRVLDRKIVILTTELKKQLKNIGNTFLSRSQQANSSINHLHANDKESQKTNERSNPSFENERHFADTLNPRVAQLENKIAQYEQREAGFNSKINELKAKNERLLEQFNKLSTASNKKINDLSQQLHSRRSRERDSFTSMENSEVSRRKQGERYKPFLTFDLQGQQPSSRPPIKGKQKNQQEYYTKTDSVVDARSRPLAFGCIPAGRKTQQNSGILSFPKMNNDSFQNLNKEDRSRRFDLLLNKLRYSEQKEGKGVVKDNSDNKGATQEFASVFAKEVVNRYHV